MHTWSCTPEISLEPLQSGRRGTITMLARDDQVTWSPNRPLIGAFWLGILEYLEFYTPPPCLKGMFCKSDRWSFSMAHGAFHVKPTPKVRQALSFRMPGIFRERETAIILLYCYQFYWQIDAATPTKMSGLRQRSSGLSAWNVHGMHLGVWPMDWVMVICTFTQQ